MSNETQLAKYREAFEVVSAATPMLSIVLYAKEPDGKYRNHSVECEWQGYLRAKQENEQVMKLAKFGAMVLSKFDYPDQEEIASELDLLCFDDRKQQYELATGIEATIKELLK